MGRKGRTEVGKSISTYLELPKQGRTVRKRYTITNDWVWTNGVKNKLGFSTVKKEKIIITHVSSMRDQENVKFGIIWF